DVTNLDLHDVQSGGDRNLAAAAHGGLVPLRVEPDVLPVDADAGGAVGCETVGGDDRHAVLGDRARFGEDPPYGRGVVARPRHAVAAQGPVRAHAQVAARRPDRRTGNRPVRRVELGATAVAVGGDHPTVIILDTAGVEDCD